MTLLANQPAPIASVAGGQKFGYNLGTNFTVIPALQAAKDGGASKVRTQIGWIGTESYTEKVYSFSSTVENAMAWCGDNDMAVDLVAGFGPPVQSPFGLTVQSNVASGSYTIPVNEPVSEIQIGTDCVESPKGDGPLTRVYCYYGGLIDSVNTTTNSIVLASATKYALTPGQILPVQRLKYPSPCTMDPNDVNVQAFVSYCLALTELMNRHGVAGHVNAWNEWIWGEDRWGCLYHYYDNAPPAMVAKDTGKGYAILSALIAATPAAGVTFTGGMTDKGGGDGIAAQGIAITAAQVESAYRGDGQHSYPGASGNPESDLWKSNSTTGSGTGTHYTLLSANTPNPKSDNGTFANLKWRNDQLGVGLINNNTETGIAYVESSDTRHAIALCRLVAASWSCGLEPEVYILASAEDTHSVCQLGGTDGSNPDLTPRPAYNALLRLVDSIKEGNLGLPGGSPSQCATLVSGGNGVDPLMVVQFYSIEAVEILLWQQTSANGTTTIFETLPSPAPTSVVFNVPAMWTTVSALDVVADTPIAATLSNGVLTVPNVADSVIAVRLGMA